MTHFIFYSLLLLSTVCAAATANTVTNPAHHTENGFKNLYIDAPDKSVLSFHKMRYFGDEPWANHEDLAYQVPIVDVELEKLTSPPNTPQVTWLGHSTFLVQHKGINVLTDPIFSDRASPISFAGPKRYVPHVMEYKRLPEINIVIISHNHYDHLDTESLVNLNTWANQLTQFYVPLGLKELLVEEGISPDNIREFDWWDKLNFTGGGVQAMPSQHWSARGLFDRFETLWASWAITIDDFSFWFAGDTGYNDVQFKEIGNINGEVDLALIPIGAYAPRWFMQHYHINPIEAVQIHLDVKARKSIGMHWGTYPLTAEEPGAPLIELEKARKSQNILPDTFMTLAIGQTISIDR